VKVVDAEEEAFLAKREEPYARILVGDDWRPLSEYVPTRDFVYVATANESLSISIAVARRGWSALSYWFGPPPAGPLSVYPVAWKPIPDGDGISVYERQEWLREYPERQKFVRPPEKVYPPGDVDVRLTPGPRELLVAMRAGAVLHERAWRWTSWTLQLPGAEPKKLTERPLNPLLKSAFIARGGVLPPGRLERMHEFDWKITEAGAAWLAANHGPAKCH
jgi:hypothetical protein